MAKSVRIIPESGSIEFIDGSSIMSMVIGPGGSSIITKTGDPVTGTVVGDTTTYATQTYVNTAVSNLVAAAPGTLDTLNELAAALGDDPNFATTVSTSIGTKLTKSSNLSDLTNTTTARTNLGLGVLATLSTVDAATITDNAVGAAELNVTGNGTTAQFLRSDGDGTFTWATPTDTNTTYSIGNGGLTEINFTSALNTKLAGIATNANNYVLPFTNNSTNWNTAYSWGNHASAGYASSNHKYHSFNNGEYYFDVYSQGNYLRLFTQTANFDQIRFQTFQNIESSSDGATWNSWAGGDVMLRTLLDGREDTIYYLPLDKRGIRFEITRNSPWPTTALIVWQETWTGLGRPNSTLNIESWDGNAWVMRDQAVFNGSTTSTNYGTHLKVSTNLHNGQALIRVTVIYEDWSTNLNYPAYNTVPLVNFMLLSNYSGKTIFPYKWDYYKNFTVDGNLYALNGDSTQWNTAYGWGNHASAGYTTNTGTVTGTGTANYISKWSGTTSQANSLIYDNGTNVGIGTTSPESLLHLAKAAAGATGPVLHLDNSAASTLGNSSDIAFSTWSGESGTAPGAKISVINTAAGSGANAFTFFTKNTAGTVTEKARITSEGNVGIGTTAPLSNLHVESATGGTLTLASSDTTITTGESVGGIDFYTTGDGSGITYRTVASIKSIADTDYAGAQAPTSLVFYTQPASVPGSLPTEKLRITNAGNVGIGVAAPTTPLHISGILQIAGAGATTFYGADATSSYSRTFTVDSYGFRDAAGAQRVAINTGTGVITATGGNSTNWNTAFGWGNHASQGYATQTYVNTAVSNLVDAAPGTLDTLNELAAALGDDPNFATTIATSIAGKFSSTGGTLTGQVVIESAADGILVLKQTDAGSVAGTKEAGWNYIEFRDGQSDRQGYFGISSGGDFIFQPEIPGGVVKIGSNRVYDTSYHPIDANSVNATALNVTGNGTATQFLRSDGDGTFTWDTPVDTNTTYSVGNNGLTEINFTSALNTKLAGIATNANNYVLPFTDNSANWNTAYTDRNKWDGGATGLVAATGRTSLGLGTLATLSTVDAATITDNSVGAAELNVTGNGTAVQFLRSDGDGTFTWDTPLDTTALLQSSMLTNQTVGALTTGTTLPAGTNLESILRTILVTYIPPTMSSLVMRTGASNVSTAARDVGNPFTVDTASFSAVADNPTGIFPVSASWTGSGADIGTQTYYFGDNVLATSNALSIGSSYTINKATANGNVTFTVNAKRSDNGAAISGISTAISFQWRNYLAASSVIPTNDTTAQTVVDASVTSALDTNRAWTATCSAANNETGNYTYIIYPAAYGNLSNIIQNGALAVISAFTNLGTFTITNAYNAPILVRIYKSNSDKAFASGTTLAIT